MAVGSAMRHRWRMVAGMGRGESSTTWVPGADGSGFGIEHLPHGVIRARGGPPRPAVRIGDQALLLAPLAEAGLLGAPARPGPGALCEALEGPTPHRLPGP